MEHPVKSAISVADFLFVFFSSICKVAGPYDFCLFFILGFHIIIYPAVIVCPEYDDFMYFPSHDDQFFYMFFQKICQLGCGSKAFSFELGIGTLFFGIVMQKVDNLDGIPACDRFFVHKASPQVFDDKVNDVLV